MASLPAALRFRGRCTPGTGAKSNRPDDSPESRIFAASTYAATFSGARSVGGAGGLERVCSLRMLAGYLTAPNRPKARSFHRFLLPGPVPFWRLVATIASGANGCAVAGAAAPCWLRTPPTGAVPRRSRETTATSSRRARGKEIARNSLRPATRSPATDGAIAGEQMKKRRALARRYKDPPGSFRLPEARRCRSASLGDPQPWC